MSDPINTTLLLYMLDEAAPVYGRLKLQKTPFFVELRLQESEQAGPTFDFIRYKLGPFSQGVWNSLNLLIAKGFIRDRDGIYQMTERGLFLRDLAEMLKPGNEAVFSVMDKALRYCKPKSGNELKDAAYEEELEPAGMPGVRLTVREVPQRVDLLHPRQSDLVVPEDLERIIAAEIESTPESRAEAKAAFPERDREGIKALLREIEGLPS